MTVVALCFSNWQPGMPPFYIVADSGFLENVCLTQRALGLLLHGHEAASPAAPEPKQVIQSDI